MCVCVCVCVCVLVWDDQFVQLFVLDWENVTEFIGFCEELERDLGRGESGGTIF